MSEPQPVISELDMVGRDYPQVEVSCKCIWKSLQVDLPGALQLFTFRFADCACELDPPDATHAYCLKGYGAGNTGVAAKLSTMPCVWIGCDHQLVVLFIPGIEA